MLLLGLRTLQTRAGSFAGTFVMIAITVTIVAAAGQLMATALGAPGAGRFAAADAVVRADPTVALGHGDNIDKVDVQRAALLPDAAVARVAAVPGVRSAVGDVTFPLAVVGPDGAPLPSTGGAPAHAHGWPSAALTPYRLAQGRAPSGPGDVVLDAGLARAGDLRVGDRVRVVTPGGAETLRLTGVARASAAQQERQSSVFLTQARAQQLSGLGAGVNAIAVRAEPGADGAELRERVGAAVRAAGADRPPAAGAAADAQAGAGADGQAAAGAGVPASAGASAKAGAGAAAQAGGGASALGAPQVLDHRHAASADAGDPRAFERVTLVAVIASGGGITTGIAIFVVAGTIAFVVGRRRREIALLRAIGATPGQVRRLLLWETALVGLLAGVAGCFASAALAGTFTDALISVGLAPDGFAIAPHWIPYATAVATGSAIALLAALLAVRRALAVRPGEALVAAAVPQRRMGIVRTLLGLVAVAGGVTLVIVLSSQAISFASLAAFCFAIGLTLLAPLLLGWPAALAGRLVRGGGGAGFLAGAALSTGRFRVGAVGAAIAVIVALAGTQVLSLATARSTAEHDSARRVTAGHVLVARDGGGLPPAVAEAAARVPGVRAAAGMVSTEVFLLDRDLTHDGDSWQAVGLDPAATRGTLDLDVRAGSLDEATRGTLDLDVRAGSLDDVRGDGIALSDVAAEDGGVRLGQVLNARLADATPARLRVVAIYHGANGMGDVVLPRDLALAHATAPLDAAVFVAGGGGGAKGGADHGASGANSGGAGSTARGLDALARAFPTVAVESRASYLDGVTVQQEDNARAQWVIAALMLLVAAMAAFNTGAMAASERRPELVLARLGGATRRQVAGALTLEALVTTLVGLAGGTAIALASLSAIGDDPTGGTLVVPWDQAGLVLAVGAALGLLGTLVPAALVGRARLTALAGLRE